MITSNTTLKQTNFLTVFSYDRLYRWAATKYIQILVRFNRIPTEMLNELAKAQEDFHAMN